MKPTRPPCVNLERLTLREQGAWRPALWCWKRKAYIKPDLCAVCQLYKPQEPAR